MPGKPQKPARDHHYLSQFYLVNFTNGGSKDDQLWVFDQKEIRQFAAIPRIVAFQRDYDRVDLPGVGIDSFEKSLGKVEKLAAPVVRKVVETHALPSGTDFDVLINFIALLFLNAPGIRKATNNQTDQISKLVLSVISESRERYEGYMERVKDESGDDFEILPYEEFVAVLERGKFTVGVTNNTHIANLLRNLDDALPSLGNRKWIVVVNTNPYHQFVCSDFPVSLTSLSGPSFWGPTLQSRDAIVTVPLSTKVMLLGRIGGSTGTAEESKTRRIALLNRCTLTRSDRYIYSAREEFVFMKASRDLGYKRDLIKMLIRRTNQQ